MARPSPTTARLARKMSTTAMLTLAFVAATSAGGAAAVGLARGFSAAANALACSWVTSIV